MRAFLLFALVAALTLYCVSCATPEYKLCAGTNDDVNISTITSNVWPPEKGKDLVLNVTGNNSKLIKSGTYTINIKVGGIPLPDVDGDIDEFKPLPWTVGVLQFQYTQAIPAAAPTGNYNIKVSAIDQDKTQIFCLTLDFHLSMQEDDASLPHSSSFKRSVKRGSSLSPRKAKVNRRQRRHS